MKLYHRITLYKDSQTGIKDRETTKTSRDGDHGQKTVAIDLS